MRLTYAVLGLLLFAPVSAAAPRHLPMEKIVIETRSGRARSGWRSPPTTPRGPAA